MNRLRHLARAARLARLAALTAALTVVATLPAAAARAQMAGVPTLQSAFPRPGLAFAVNAGSADDGRAVGGAAAWGLRGGRFGLSAGAALFSPPDGYRSSALTYGGRLAVSAISFASGRLAVVPFAGAGRVELRRASARGGDDDGTGVLRLLGGATLGYRRGVGERGAISLFTTPLYVQSRPDSAGAPSDGLFRAAFGVEYGLPTRLGAIGLTAGFELGQGATEGQVGPRGGAFGVGIAIARGARATR